MRADVMASKEAVTRKTSGCLTSQRARRWVVTVHGY